MTKLRMPLLFAVLAASLIVPAPRAAAAEWYWPRLEVGYGVANATPVADFTRLQVVSGGGFPEERRMEYESSTQASVRIYFELHPELQFGWTRSWRSTALLFSIDGTFLESGDTNPRTDQPVIVPDFDLTTDLLSFRWWPMKTRWRGIGPTVTLGAGRISQEQKGEFATDSAVRTFDWSADDFALVIGTGLEGRWSRVRAGLGLDVVRWRYEAPTEDTAGNPISDLAIPPETTVSFEVTGRVSIGF